MFAALITFGLFAFGSVIIAVSVHLCEHWSRQDLNYAFDGNRRPRAPVPAVPAVPAKTSGTAMTFPVDTEPFARNGAKTDKDASL